MANPSIPENSDPLMNAPLAEELRSALALAVKAQAEILGIPQEQDVKAVRKALMRADGAFGQALGELRAYHERALSLAIVEDIQDGDP